MICLFVAILTGACQKRQEVPGPAVVQDTMTNVLVGLALEQLTSSNPAAIEQIINCEVERLYHDVGWDSADKLIKVADARIKANSTRAQRRRVQDSLALKVFVSGQGCDTLAASGRLGGPFPLDRVPRRLPGETW